MAEKHITGLGRSFNYCFGWKSNPSRFVFFISVNSTQLNNIRNTNYAYGCNGTECNRLPYSSVWYIECKYSEGRGSSQDAEEESSMKVYVNTG